MSRTIKVIFLDIDGVLNVYLQGRDEYGAIFHQHFIDNLAELINATDAKIVISSTWRMSGKDVMLEMWENRNLPGEIIDVTPWIYGVKRGVEIQQWLDGQDNVISYVILDDDKDILPEQLDNFVHCADNPEHTDPIDIGYGLTKECVLKAITILNHEHTHNR